MKRRGSAIQVIPSARRLIRSLRDLGYDFPQAVADLVDNSVTAGATRIKIDIHFEGPDSWLRIVDDGSGMDSATITEAMRYGSDQSYDDEALGKFGLGLKTASLSQCRNLIVASRTGAGRKRVEVRQLDLDYVSEANRWEIFALEASRCDARLVDPLEAGPGTVVLWQSLDRVLGFKIPWGKRARSALDSLATQLDLHLAMVFHRFLAGEVDGRRRLRILINGRNVRPWNPFATDEPATQVLPACEIDVQTPDGIGIVRFQPYVLPPRERFSSEEAFHRLAGPRKWNAQQGFYIYRAHRMIQSGGWSRMRALDEHVKLARAAIDFFPELDAAFEINVAKVRAVLPAYLKEELARPVESLVRAAQAAYREHSGSGTVARAESFAVPASGSSAARTPVRRALELAARKARERDALERIVIALRRTNPRVAKSLGW